MDKLIKRRDLDFMLYEVMNVADLAARERYSAHDRETFDAVIDAACKLALDHFEPHAAELDACEPAYDNGRVRIIPAVKAALDRYCEAGFMGAGIDYEYGGMQLPWVVVQACNAYFNAANISTTAYPFITIAAANLLAAYGSPEQKERYLKPLVAGRFFGTMALSEPQAGSSLSDIRTKATRTEKGHYLITGNKMWISAAEHDLSENIVHLVLTKIPGGPPGVKGISLMLVPKFRLNADGSPGEPNNVTCMGLNHKMGYRGTVNTVLSFGEQGECHGYLIGEENRGLAYMFNMMNEARVGVGLGGAALGYTGYLHSLDYARERPQGRHPQNKDPASPQVRIVEHADIKRLLLAQKVAAEGALALVLYCARLLDLQCTESDPAELTRLGLLLDLLTPIVKSWPGEFCLEANKHAIQILGGAGYTSDYPVERFYRDNRLNPIHEGAHGIHGIDLLGRKVTMGDSAAFKVFVSEVEATIAAARPFDTLGEFADELAETLRELEATTAELIKIRDAGEVTLFLANASLYLDTFGHIVIAWIWLMQAVAAAPKADAGADVERDFYRGKLQACRYFYRYELNKVPERLSLLAQADDTCVTMDEAWF
ncbi:MAG: acyl-CoA dehydrogenase [Gammaproteobacteria bacterium]|jgi:butyryl-CoA dehydrogenase